MHLQQQLSLTSRRVGKRHDMAPWHDTSRICTETRSAGHATTSALAVLLLGRAGEPVRPHSLQLQLPSSALHTYGVP